MAAMAMVDETASLSLVAAARALRESLVGFEPALVSGQDAARAVTELALTEKVCAAARARAASRAAECGAHRDAGFSRPTDWLAKSGRVAPASVRALRREVRDSTRTPKRTGSHDSPGTGSVRVASRLLATGHAHSKRFGRHIPAELLTLLGIGDPPDFEGAKCVDCGSRFAREIDHVDPRANGGPTSHDNLKPRCPPCHREKTERDREAGLLGPRAKREGRGPP